jgi:FkbM family methyltransferase
MSKRIIFDVGANDGKETLERAQDKNSIIYAFEPTYELLINHLWPMAYENDNIIVLPFAVDIESKFKKFNVAGTGDWGCSSLHTFSDDIKQKWPGRPDFVMTHSYIVPTITLFDFCNIYGIDKIDFIEIDTQGNDFNVLKSLKEKISIVESGVVEASNNVDLYKGVDNRIESIKKYLVDNGFEITNEFENDYLSAEVNIHFKKIKK